MEVNKLKKAIEAYPIHTLTLIGKGKYSYVYQLSDDKVIKVIRNKYQKKSEFSKLKKEVYFYEQVNDLDFIPKVYEHGEDYIVLEYIKGKTFFDLLFEGTKITKMQMKEVDMLLQKLEMKNVYHNDTHFENIIYGENKKLYLIDLGNAEHIKSNKKWVIIKKIYPFYNKYGYFITRFYFFKYCKKPYKKLRHLINFLLKSFSLLKKIFSVKKKKGGKSYVKINSDDDS